MSRRTCPASSNFNICPEGLVQHQEAASRAGWGPLRAITHLAVYRAHHATNCAHQLAAVNKEIKQIRAASWSPLSNKACTFISMVAAGLHAVWTMTKLCTPQRTCKHMPSTARVGSRCFCSSLGFSCIAVKTGLLVPSNTLIELKENKSIWAPILWTNFQDRACCHN